MTAATAPVLPSFAAEVPLFLIAGPCAIESETLATEVAAFLKSLCTRLQLPLIFKASYDKANRSSATGARGVGLQRGLEILSAIRRDYQLPVLTDVHLPQDAAVVAEVADVLQIPAFLCRQTDLITACAETGKAMNIKKGQFLAPDDMRHVVDKARAAGCDQVCVCERGTSFGYHHLINDMRALVWLRQTGCPVVFDATHSAQLPGGDRTGGLREMVPALARAAVAVGINGLFVETHPDPTQAQSDAATQWPLAEMEALLTSVLALDRARKETVAE